MTKALFLPFPFALLFFRRLYYGAAKDCPFGAPVNKDSSILLTVRTDTTCV